MQIDWDAPIRMDDGVVLRADVFRPVGGGKYPVILSYGPYAKGLSFQEGYPSQWGRVIKVGARTCCKARATSIRTGNWSTRRNGCRTATLACASTRAAPGARRAISTSGRRARRRTSTTASNGPARKAWSNGKVGINGISYYAMNQWNAGALQPPHLAALCMWEGSSDYYRELCRHGGILCDFLNSWYPRQVASVQHGVGDAWRQEPGDGRTRRWTRDACRTKNSPRPAPIRRARRSGAVLRRLLRRAHRRLRADRGAVSVRRQLGRRRPAHARQFRRLARAPAPSRNGWKCMATRISRISTAHTAKPCRSVSSPISSRARTAAGASSRASRSMSAIRTKNSCCAPRTNGRSRARNGQNIFCSRTA